MIGDRFAFRDEKDRVLILLLRLQPLNMAVVVGSRKELDGTVLVFLLQRINIELVYFLAQHHAFAGAQRFAPFFGREDLRASRSGSGSVVFLKVSQNVLFGWAECLEPGGEILVLEV